MHFKTFSILSPQQSACISYYLLLKKKQQQTNEQVGTVAISSTKSKLSQNLTCYKHGGCHAKEYFRISGLSKCEAVNQVCL